MYQSNTKKIVCIPGKSKKNVTKRRKLKTQKWNFENAKVTGNFFLENVEMKFLTISNVNGKIENKRRNRRVIYII
jgi:hypothetical protein